MVRGQPDDCCIDSLFVEHHGLFRTDRSGQKGAVILADFFGHQLVEQSIHALDRIFVLLSLQGEVVQLVGILIEIEQLNVIVFKI